MLKLDQFLVKLNRDLKFELGVPFAMELNAVSRHFAPSDCELKFKELAIDILRPLCASHQEMKNILRRDNLHYFQPSPDNCVSLRQKISQTYSKSLNEKDAALELGGSDQDYGQMIGFVSTLMPGEWRPVCKSDPAPDTMILPVTQELILLQELDSQVSYRVLRSLCSELPASWTNMQQMIRLDKL